MCLMHQHPDVTSGITGTLTLPSISWILDILSLVSHENWGGKNIYTQLGLHPMQPHHIFELGCSKACFINVTQKKPHRNHEHHRLPPCFHPGEFTVEWPRDDGKIGAATESKKTSCFNEKRQGAVSNCIFLCFLHLSLRQLWNIL